MSKENNSKKEFDKQEHFFFFLSIPTTILRWPTKMPKMIKGQIAENWKLTITPKCRKCFGQLGQNVEKLFIEIVSMFWKICWKQSAH